MSIDQNIKIYPQEPCLIPVQFLNDSNAPANPLTVYNKTYSDVEEIVMCFKTKPLDSEDKFFAKYFYDGNGGNTPSNGVFLDETTHTFTMNKLETDILPVSEKGYHLFKNFKERD